MRRLRPSADGEVEPGLGPWVALSFALTCCGGVPMGPQLESGREPKGSLDRLHFLRDPHLWSDRTKPMNAPRMVCQRNLKSFSFQAWIPYTVCYHYIRSKLLYAVFWRPGGAAEGSQPGLGSRFDSLFANYHRGRGDLIGETESRTESDGRGPWGGQRGERNGR